MRYDDNRPVISSKIPKAYITIIVACTAAIVSGSSPQVGTQAHVVIIILNTSMYYCCNYIIMSSFGEKNKLDL